MGVGDVKKKRKKAQTQTQTHTQTERHCDLETEWKGSLDPLDPPPPFIPFTSCQWTSTWMVRTGHITMSAVPSKTRHRSLYGAEYSVQCAVCSGPYSVWSVQCAVLSRVSKRCDCATVQSRKIVQKLRKIWVFERKNTQFTTVFLFLSFEVSSMQCT